MELRNLPLDGIRPILALLDYGSLVRLHSTFDRKIQALLRSPNALSCVSIDRRVPEGPARYFLWSLGEITRLEIPEYVQWKLATLSLLARLNPLELSFGPGLLSESVVDAMLDFNRQPTSDIERQLMDLKRFGFPDLARLTPRLRSLQSLTHMQTIFPSSGCYGYSKQRNWNQMLAVMEAPCSLPPTLTSLVLQEPGHFPKLEQLPPTITTLDVLGLPLDSLNMLGNRLPNLSSLSIKLLADAIIPEDVMKDPDCRLPSTLTSLTLDCTATLFSPFLFTLGEEQSSLPPLRLQTPSLTHFGLHTSVKASTASNVNLSLSLPSSVTSLVLSMPLTRQVGSINHTAAQPVVFASFPPSLTHLTWNLGQEHQDQLLDSLSRLKNLNKFHLTVECPFGVSLADMPDYYTYVPPTVLDLELTSTELLLKPTHIETLPRTLTRLCASMSLACAELSRTHLPHCYIEISRTVYLWHDDDGQYLQHKFFPPRCLNMPILVTAIHEYYLTLRIFFTLDCSRQDKRKGPMTIRDAEQIDHFFHRSMPQDLIGPVKFVEYDSEYWWFFELVRFETIDLDLFSHPLTLPPFDALIKTTTLDLGSIPCWVDWSAFPATLTRLTATSTPTYYVQKPPTHILRLRHLDTPNWYFTYSQLVHHCDMSAIDTLKCIVNGVAYGNLLPFLTQALSPKTRSGTLVRLIMLLDGSLVNDEDGIGPSTVDYATLERSMDDLVQTQLSLPMPSSSSSDANINTSSTQVYGETVGHVVKSVTYRLHQQDIDECAPSLMLPFCASTISVTAPNGWVVSVNNRHTYSSDASSSATSGDSHAASAETSSLPPLHLPVPGLFSPNNNLTRLELLGIGRVSEVWASLPTSLRVLRLKALQILASIDHRFPPQLEVLVIETYRYRTPHPRECMCFRSWTRPEPSDDQTNRPWPFPSHIDQLSHSSLSEWNLPLLRLPFSLSQLPYTLRHLVIDSQEQFTLCLADMQLRYRDAPESQLPELQTVVFGEMRGWSGQLMRLLPLHQLKRFELAALHSFHSIHPPPASLRTTFTYPLQHEIASGKVVEMTYSSEFDLATTGILEPLTLMDCTQ